MTRSETKFFKFIYFVRESETRREKVHGGGAGRENPKQALCWQHRAWSRFNLTNWEIMTRAKIKSWALHQLSHPGTPQTSFNLTSLALHYHLPNNSQTIRWCQRQPRNVHNMSAYYWRTRVFNFLDGKYYMETDYSFDWEIEAPIHYIKEEMEWKILVWL